MRRYGIFSLFAQGQPAQCPAANRLQAPPELTPEILCFLAGGRPGACPQEEVLKVADGEPLDDSPELQQQLAAQVDSGDLNSALDTLVDIQAARAEPVIIPHEDQLARALQAGDVPAAQRALRAAVEMPINAELLRPQRPRRARTTLRSRHLL